MYKITQQTKDGMITDRYTIQAYSYSKESRGNKELYSISNLTTDLLTKYLGESFDLDFTTVVLTSNGSPCILTESGNIPNTPVRVPVVIKSKKVGH